MKYLKIFKQNGFWHAELWGQHYEPFLPDYFEDKVKADNWIDLQIEIGNKNWIDLLNKD